MVGDFLEISVDTIRAQLVVERRDDGHRAYSQLAITFTGANGLASIRFGSPGQDRNSATGLVNDDFNDANTFFGGEASEFTGRSVGVEAMNTMIDQPVHVATCL